MAPDDFNSMQGSLVAFRAPVTPELESEFRYLNLGSGTGQQRSSVRSVSFRVRFSCPEYRAGPKPISTDTIRTWYSRYRRAFLRATYGSIDFPMETNFIHPETLVLTKDNYKPRNTGFQKIICDGTEDFSALYSQILYTMSRDLSKIYGDALVIFYPEEDYPGYAMLVSKLFWAGIAVQGTPAEPSRGIVMKNMGEHVLLHEWGHTRGLSHSNSYSNIAAGTILAYGDTKTEMGSGEYFVFSPPQGELLGFMSPVRVVSLNELKSMTSPDVSVVLPNMTGKPQCYLRIDVTDSLKYYICFQTNSVNVYSKSEPEPKQESSVLIKRLQRGDRGDIPKNSKAVAALGSSTIVVSFSSQVSAGAQVAVSLQSTTSPAESTTSPAESTTSPAESTTSPAESTTSPAESTTSPAGPKPQTAKEKALAQKEKDRTARIQAFEMLKNEPKSVNNWMDPKGKAVYGSAIRDVVLRDHNAYRSYYGVQPLTWDDDLAESSARWALQLCKSGSLLHSGSDGGENLLGGDAYEMATHQWHDEIVFWNWDKRRPNEEGEGLVGPVGHFTQVVNRRAKKVGCASVPGESCKGPGFQVRGVTVCQYDAGNTFKSSPSSSNPYDYSMPRDVPADRKLNLLPGRAKPGRACDGRSGKCVEIPDRL